MAKLTGNLGWTSVRRPIPPPRPMPDFSSRPRAAAFISAKTVGSFVPGLTRRAFEKFGFSTVSLITDWEKIVGARFAAYTEPQRLKWSRLPGALSAAPEETAARPGATLTLKVDAARALDIEYGAAQIIDRINTYFGYRAVAEIRLVQAPLTNVTASPRRGAAIAPRAATSPGRLAIADGGRGASLDSALERLAACVASRNMKLR
jgi:hypothetical protein